MALGADTRLLHYRLVEMIGEGGMGTVWRAVDNDLNREVAVKILPEPFASDPERLARFEREARLLASLNHPNIAAIYGLHEAQGVRFLAMELVEGEDLGARLRRGPVPVADALTLTGQITEALEAAHDQGIVHRDLKPANIMLTSGCRVKVLDFGLAKAMEASTASAADPAMSPTITSAGTVAGMILGTAAYMSPEQARGEAADHRADIWSIGCLLYEMLSGKRPFKGQTVPDTLAAVLKSEPDWSALPEGTPQAVLRMLRRCLAKDRGQRLHHVADARLDLVEQEEPSQPASDESIRRYRMLTIALILTLAATLITIGSMWRQDAAPAPSNPLADARFTRITDFPGAEYEANISPDGRFVVFMSDRDGEYEPYVGQIGSTGFRKLTPGLDQVPLGGPQTTVRAIGFSSDGSEIWFNGGPWQRMKAMPFLGGAWRSFLEEDSVTVDWSPDGRRVVYQNLTAGDPLFIAEGNGSNPVRILAPQAGVHQHYPAWSADGKWIYFSRGTPTTLQMDLYRVRTDGTGLEQLTEQLLDVAYPTPLDDDTVLYSARDHDGAGPWLWALEIPTKISRRASLGLEKFASVASSADGRRLVATLQEHQAGLWRMPILDRIATERDIEPLRELPVGRALSPRFGGRSMFYLSSRGSSDGLWRFEDGQISEIWRGSDVALLEPAAVSTDGGRVALLLRGTAGWHLHTLNADGTGLTLLTDRVEAQGTADWSPDGQWIVTGGAVNGVEGLYKIPAAGGEPVRIVKGKALNPIWSPKGDLIVYAGPEVQVMAPLLGVRPDGSPVELPDIELFFGAQRARFLPDGSGLVYMQGNQPAQDFWILDLNTFERRQLSGLSDEDQMWTFDITPDGAAIVFDRISQDSDIVLIELN